MTEIRTGRQAEGLLHKQFNKANLGRLSCPQAVRTELDNFPCNFPSRKSDYIDKPESGLSNKQDVQHKGTSTLSYTVTLRPATCSENVTRK